MVLNTCCIRENADNKLYGNLGHLKRHKDARPDLQIVVAGCLAQKDRDLVRAEGAPRRRRPRHPQRPPRRRAARPTPAPHGPITEILDEAVRRRPRPVPLGAAGAARRRRHTAWVTIQIGCDNSCAFCIVPAVRGPEISRPFADIVAEVEALAAGGVTEVTLLGQNVNSYGRDLTLAARQGGRRARPGPAPVRRPAPGRGRRRGHPAGPLHQPAPQGPPARHDRRHGRHPGGLRAPPPPAPGRLRPRPGGHAPRLHRRPLPRAARRGPRRRRRPRRHHRPHRRLPGRDRRRLRAHPRGGGGRRVRLRLHLHLLAPPRHRGGRAHRPVRRSRRRARERFERLRVVVERSRAGQAPGPHRPGRGGARRRARARRTRRSRTGRTRQNKLVHFRADPAAAARHVRRRPRSPTPRRTTSRGRLRRGRGRAPPTAPASRWWRADGGSRRPSAIVGPDGVGQVGPGPGPGPPAPGRRRARLGRRHAGVPGHGHRHGQAHAPPSRPRCPTTASTSPTPEDVTVVALPGRGRRRAGRHRGPRRPGRAGRRHRPVPAGRGRRPRPAGRVARRPGRARGRARHRAPPRPPRGARPGGGGQDGADEPPPGRAGPRGARSAAAGRSLLRARARGLPADEVVQVGLRWPRAELAARIEAALRAPARRRLPRRGRRARLPGRRACPAPPARRSATASCSTTSTAGRRSTRRSTWPSPAPASFAVRQERWFRRDPRIRWVDVDRRPDRRPRPSSSRSWPRARDADQAPRARQRLPGPVRRPAAARPRRSACLAQRWCDRRRGIGADGLSSAARRRPRRTPTSAMVLFNADGSRAEMSGNGIRCLAQAWARRNDARRGRRVGSPPTPACRSSTSGPVPTSAPIVASVAMGAAEPSSRPTAGPRPACDPMRPSPHLSLGNPHAVVAVDDVEAVDLARPRRAGPDVNLEIVAPARATARAAHARPRAGRRHHRGLRHRRRAPPPSPPAVGPRRARRRRRNPRAHGRRGCRRCASPRTASSSLTGPATYIATPSRYRRMSLIERAIREKIVLVGVTLPPATDDDTEASLDELALPRRHRRRRRGGPRACSAARRPTRRTSSARARPRS